MCVCGVGAPVQICCNIPSQVEQNIDDSGVFARVNIYSQIYTNCFRICYFESEIIAFTEIKFLVLDKTIISKITIK